MLGRYFDIRREGSYGGNCIPSGRQLPRTPPLTTDVKRHLDFSRDDSNMEDNDMKETFDASDLGYKTEPGDHAMLKGMKGYQLTESDLEFINKMQEEKLIKKLQRDLEEVLRLLKKETMATEMVVANRERAQAELNKFPTCAELTEWVKLVLSTTLPLEDLTDLDTKSLLAMVTKDDVQKFAEEKKMELARMGKMMENKKKREAEEREQLEKHIADEQMKIQGLMCELSNLKFELQQQEEACKAVEMQVKTQEAPKTKAEPEKVGTSEETQDSKSQVKRRGRQRKNAEKSSDELQDANQSRSTRSRRANSRADNQPSVKVDHPNTTTLETKPKSRATSQKPPTSVKAARGPQKKVKETESNLQESERPPNGQKRPLGRAQTAALQPKNRREAKVGEAPSRKGRQAAESGEEAPSAGLRRSKRIASWR